MERIYSLQDLVKANETLAIAAQHLIDMEEHMRLALYHNNRCLNQLRQYNARRVRSNPESYSAE